MKNQRGLHGAQRLFMCQSGLTLVLAVIAFIISGNKAAFSVILGGLLSIIPNMYFASVLFKHQGAQAAKQIVNGFYKGEAMKLLLTILLFALVFKYCSVIPLLFFTVYILVQAVLWLAPWLFNNH